MNEAVCESCANCANIHNCSGPDYIDGSCYPGFKPKDQNKKKNYSIHQKKNLKLKLLHVL